MEGQVLDKAQISRLLQEKHEEFIRYVSSLDENAFHFSFENKWTAGQQMDHIRKSVSMLNFVLTFPKWFLRWYFPKANRPSRTYEELVKRYHEKLAKGGKVPARFVPNMVPFYRRGALIERLSYDLQRLIKLIQKFSEKDMDKMTVPHPLLGKITVREMGYFTIYHVQHHQALTKRNLEHLAVGSATLMQF